MPKSLNEEIRASQPLSTWLDFIIELRPRFGLGRRLSGVTRGHRLIGCGNWLMSFVVWISAILA